MTQSDKDWLEERFKRVYDKIDTYDPRLCKVESKTSSNSRVIWMLSGAFILITLIASLISFNVKM